MSRHRSGAAPSAAERATTHAGVARRPAQCSLQRGPTQAANRHVLGFKKLLAPPSQYPVARFSVQVVCNKVLLGSHLENAYHKQRLAAVQTVRAREPFFMLHNCASERVNNRT